MINPLFTFRCLKTQIQRYHDLDGVVNNGINQQKVIEASLQSDFEFTKLLARKTVDMIEATGDLTGRIASANKT